MEIFNIGIPELLLIFLLALILVGPQQMVVFARNLAKTIRKVTGSPMWNEMMNTSREIREIPTKLMQDTGLDVELTKVRKDMSGVVDSTAAPVKEINAQITDKKPGEESNIPVVEETTILTNEIKPPDVENGTETIQKEGQSEKIQNDIVV